MWKEGIKMYVSKKIETFEIGNKRKRGRPKLKWRRDGVEEDLRMKM